MNPLRALGDYGQSVWLDFIRRNSITSGELQRLVNEDGLRGVTSNPAIFEKAITGSTDYANELKALESEDLSAKEIYEIIAIRDIQDAADILWPVYQSSNLRDGYVSLEVSPSLANDTNGTLEEAHRLRKRVARDNVMIKVPGTDEGVPAIKKLISEGINVNVTLLFSQQAYERVAEAYISGLEDLAKKKGDLAKVASVASFFISRIDALIDSMVTTNLKTETDPKKQELLKSVTGKVAIANAKLVYQAYKKIFSGDRWEKLAAKGAQTQRLLWASTSTKNPAYRDVIYIEELIGADTVNTIPPATFDAFRDHGRLDHTLDSELPAAEETMANLKKAGIDMDAVTTKLLVDGLKLFVEPFDKLLASVDLKAKQKEKIEAKINHLTYKLPEHFDKAVKTSLSDWRANGKMRKLWSGDASLWTGSDEANWLGWLNITDDQLAHSHHLTDFADEIAKEGFDTALLLGMGGSSLCPEVMTMTYGKIKGHPELRVLDSTDPAQVKYVESKIDPAKTLFIVSSKSGSTLEPNIFKDYFYELTKKKVGADKVGRHFAAVTDPGSKMEKVATQDKFRHIFHGLASIGGRYSALSDFGLVPAAVMGLDMTRFLNNTEEMVHACTPSVPVDLNPGAVLGAILGTLGRQGHDKVTIFCSPGIGDLGAWLEQLLAESTGKEGKGLIPVDREEIGAPDVYGDDRIFCYLRLETAPDKSQDAKVDALEKAGHPVVRINVADIYDLGQEMFRWEIATAVAGSILGINPFNQPDVEASKIETRDITQAYEKTGKLPAEKPIFEEGGIKLFTDERNAANLMKAAGSDKTLAGILKAHLNQLGRGDYFALLAYVQMNDEHDKPLQSMRHAVRDKKHVATCLGFGPRFLHSTGQAYKGGPNSGVFLQLTCDDAKDVEIPNARYTFGVVKAAQARGDFQVLAKRNRRALRVHLPADVEGGLKTLQAAIKTALG